MINSFRCKGFLPVQCDWSDSSFKSSTLVSQTKSSRALLHAQNVCCICSWEPTGRSLVSMCCISHAWARSTANVYLWSSIAAVKIVFIFRHDLGELINVQHKYRMTRVYKTYLCVAGSDKPARKVSIHDSIWARYALWVCFEWCIESRIANITDDLSLEWRKADTSKGGNWTVCFIKPQFASNEALDKIAQMQVAS